MTAAPPVSGIAPPDTAPRPSSPGGAGRFTPVVPWPAAGSVDEHVRTEQVRLLFRQAPLAQLLSIVAAAVLVVVLYDVADRTALRWWFAALAAVTAGRIALGLAFRRRAPAHGEMLRWELAFIATLTVVALTWGVGGWLVMPEALLPRAVVYVYLMGIAGGAAASYGAHPGATAFALTAIILPATVSFAVSGTTELVALAFGGAVYVAAAVRSTVRYAFFMRRTFELSFELHRAWARAQTLARTDELTGLANRRAFVELGRAALEQARRYGRPLALVTFDVDHFKQINDTFGHAAGDEVLRQVAVLVRAAQRASDTAGRLGGEEFAVLLPETSAAEGAAFAERLRGAMAATIVLFEGREIRFTCSFGVADATESSARLDGLLGAADAALYRAKTTGRNRVSVA